VTFLKCFDISVIKGCGFVIKGLLYIKKGPGEPEGCTEEVRMPLFHEEPVASEPCMSFSIGRCRSWSVDASLKLKAERRFDMMKRPIVVLVLFIVVLFPLASEVDVLLFPVEPVDMSLSPNPDVPITRVIAGPWKGFSEVAEDKTLGGLWGDLSNTDFWAALGESLPLIALRLGRGEVVPSSTANEILRLTAVVGGMVNFHGTNFVDYLVKGDIFLASSAFDCRYNPYKLNMGNGLVLSAGYMGKGTAFSEEVFWDSPMKVLDENFLTFHGYMVARAPWTNQFLVLDVGYNKPLDDDTKMYFDLSASMSFPVMAHGRNFLYIAGYLKIYNIDYIPKIIGQAGIVIPGERRSRSLVIYSQIEKRYDDPVSPTYHGRLGVKLNLL
jgi:hypothetical protein